jgi:uncharacterized protein (DUF305 family)
MNQKELLTIVLTISVSILVFELLRADARPQGDRDNSDSSWSELIASMEKMHMAMGEVARSGNSDVDFVRLMIPHHQAALDMAKTQLLYGKDPQIRRLAQEIITDQQLEIELMQLWLKQHEPAQSSNDQAATEIKRGS